MEALTREEFIAKHGFDPEQAAGGRVPVPAAGPAPVVPLPRPAPYQKELTDQQIISHYTPTPQTPITSDDALGKDPFIRVGRDVGAELLSMVPGTYGGIKGIGQALLKAAKDGLDPNEEAGFAKSLFREGGETLLDQHLHDKLTTWRKENPDIGDEDLRDLMTQYRHSKDFYNYMSGVLHDGFETARNWNTWAMETMGDQRHPDQLTWYDDMIRVLGSAAVGLPRSVTVKAADYIASTAVQKVLENRISKIALRTAEALTPVTFPLTKTTFAVNAGVGAAITEGTRLAAGDPALLTGDAFKAEASEHGALSTNLAMMGAFGAMLRASRGARPHVEPPLSGGPTSVRAPELDAPDFRERSANVIDELAPVATHLQRELGVEKTDEILGTMASNMGHVKGQKIENAREGMLPDGVRMSVSAKQIEAMVGSMDEATRAEWMNAMTARNVLRDRDLQEKQLYEKINDTAAALAKTTNKEKRDELQVELADARQKLQLVQQDAPNMRPSLEGKSTSELRLVAARIDQNPEFKKLASAYDKHMDEMLDYGSRSGILSAAEVAHFRANRSGAYVPLREDPFAGKTGWDRWISIKRADAAKIDKSESKSTPTTLFAGRNLEGNLERTVVNNPVDPITSMHSYVTRFIDGAITNTFRRNAIDALSRLPDYKHTLVQHTVNGRTQFSAAEYSVIKKFIPDDAIVVRRDGMIEAWKVGDPLLQNLLKQNPDLVGLGMRVGMAINRGVHLGSTGVLAPYFVVKNIGYELISGAVQKNAARRFNPVEGLYRVAKGIIQSLHEEGRYRATSEIAYRSLSHNGVLTQMFGADRLKQFADRMAQHYWESTSGLLKRYGVLYHARYANTYEADAAYRKFMTSNPLPASIHALGSPLRGVKVLFDGYASMLDTLLNAPKRAFWESNIKKLEKKYGKGNIPEIEFNKLAYETHTLTGDLSRRAGSKGLQNVNRLVPYQSVALQGTRSAVRRSARASAEGVAKGEFGRALQLLAYGVAPVATTAVLLSTWSKASHQYYWEEMTDFQRQGAIYIPHPKDLADLALWASNPEKHKKPEFNPNKGWWVAMSPEFVPAASAAVAAMRGIGLLDSTMIPSNALDDWLKSMQTVLGNMTPAFAQLIAATSGVQIDLGRYMLSGEPIFRQTNPARYQGAGAGKMNNGELPAVTRDVMTALLGSAGAMMTAAVDAGLQGYKEGGIGLAIKTGARELGHEYASRTVDVPFLWNADEKYYRSTPVRQVVDKQAKAMQQISRIWTEANPSDRAKAKVLLNQGATQRRIIPPDLAPLARDVHNVFARAGRFKDLEEKRGLLVAKLYEIDTKRVSRTPQERSKEKAGLIREIGAVERTIRDHQDQMLGNLYSRYGVQFEAQYKAPFTFENIAKVTAAGVRGNLRH